MTDLSLLIVPALSFAAVAAVVLVVGQYYATAVRVQRRLPGAARPYDLPADQPQPGLHSFIARHFDEKRFGIDAALHEKLRRQLLKAGFFQPYAVNYYIFARIAGVLAFPILVYLFSALVLSGIPSVLQIALVAISVLVAIAGPDAYLARRRRLLALRYRQVFPDLLDLLVVCVDAGLSLEAAFDRVRGEAGKQSHELGMNLQLMGAEMRAGRSTIEALESFADRIGLDEAASFVTMLRQSLELGSDIGEALAIFGEEMREKRLLRAEEAANKLSVKMVLPLGLFIFPVVLLVVMLPVVIKLISVLR